MNLLRTADIVERLGFTRRRALKFMAALGAHPCADEWGRRDYVTTADAVELALTLATVKHLAPQFPLNDLQAAAVELALAAQLKHARQLAQLREPKPTSTAV